MSGSFGRYASHWLRLFENWTPPSAITFVAPVARTASTSVCMPAAWYGVWVFRSMTAPPSRQIVHAVTLSLSSSGNGSLKGSKMTASFPLNALATCDQNAGEWSASGIGCCIVAGVVPGALQWRSRLA